MDWKSNSPKLAGERSTLVVRTAKFRPRRKPIRIGQFRVALCLCFKASLCAEPFMWKCVPPTCSFSYDMFVLKQRHKITREWLFLFIVDQFGHLINLVSGQLNTANNHLCKCIPRGSCRNLNRLSSVQPVTLHQLLSTTKANTYTILAWGGSKGGSGASVELPKWLRW